MAMLLLYYCIFMLFLWRNNFLQAYSPSFRALVEVFVLTVLILYKILNQIELLIDFVLLL